jgi:hypothetical protein
MTINPTAVHYGEYRFIPSAVPTANAYVLDDTDRVFEIAPDCSLKEAGFLRDRAKSKHQSSVSFHPRGTLAAYITETGMAVSDLHGNRMWEINTPVAGLLFSENGEALWIAQKPNAKRIRVSIVCARSGTENAVLEMPDPLYDSGVQLQNMPQGDGVLMELAAGQDGVAVFLLTGFGTPGGAILAKELFPKVSNILPAFSPYMTWLLTLENDEQLYYAYSWPGLSLVARQRDYTDEVRENDEEAYPGYSMIFLRNGLAITQSASYRFYLFDPMKMERLSEIVIAGFEPLPVREVFSHTNDEAPYSILDSIARHGGFLAAKTAREAKSQALLIFREDDLPTLKARGLTWHEALDAIYGIFEKNALPQAREELLNAQLYGGTGAEILASVSAKLARMKDDVPEVYRLIAREAGVILDAWEDYRYDGRKKKPR